MPRLIGVHCSLDAVVEAEIRTSSRPGSQAPHAPPALTFGLPGKQRVNRLQAGCDLTRLLNSLPANRNIFPNGTIGGGPRSRRARTAAPETATCARVFPPARSGLAGNR